VPGRATISTILLRPLAGALQASPQALAGFYAAADVTEQMLADADARVSPAQFCVAWAEAVRLRQDAGLGLSLAETMPPGAFGVVEYVCRSAATLGAALAYWVRYLRILDDAVEVAIVEEGDQAAVRVVTESDAPAPASHELCFAVMVRNARFLLLGGTPFRVTEVRYTHRADEAHRARHRAFFEAPVVFGARTTELVFPRTFLAAPLASADPNLLHVLLAAAEEKRAKPAMHLPLTDQVRRVLRPLLTDDLAQLDTVAKRLGMTGRSLQRRLKDEGTSFQETRDAVRQELADAYLGQGMSFAEISFLLGFAEPSAFFRAFKRWTGVTPLERKASLGAA
jgi:AraC-like DNA-binding protein